MATPDSLQTLMPFIAAISFGIQQFLQVVVDPVATAVITAVKNAKNGSLPGGITDADAKKVGLGLVSFGLGLLIVSADENLRILAKAGFDQQLWDVFVTALTISAGSEGMNSVTKVLQYLKDRAK